MAASPICFAVVGLGRVAGHHVRALAAIPDARLVALCDLHEERAAAYGAPLGLPCYTNYFTMLARHPEIEVVNLATPSGMHFEHACDFLAAEPKHLVIEKPMVMTPAEGRELQTHAQRAGRHIYPIYQNRYNRAVQRVRRAVREGELGEVVLGTVRLRWCRTQPYYARDAWRGTFSHDGGALTNQGIHYLDLLRYLAGDLTMVQSRLKTLGVTVEVEDTGTALGDFVGGGSAVIEVTTAARPHDLEASISILGTKGHAVLTGIACNELAAFSPAPAEMAAHSEAFPDAYGFGHGVLFREIIAHLRGGPFPLTSFADGMQTIQLLHALYRSDELGQPVQLADAPASVRLGRPNDTLSQLYRTARP